MVDGVPASRGGERCSQGGERLSFVFKAEREIQKKIKTLCLCFQRYENERDLKVREERKEGRMKCYESIKRRYKKKKRRTKAWQKAVCSLR